VLIEGYVKKVKRTSRGSKYYLVTLENGITYLDNIMRVVGEYVQVECVENPLGGGVEDGTK